MQNKTKSNTTPWIVTEMFVTGVKCILDQTMHQFYSLEATTLSLRAAHCKQSNSCYVKKHKCSEPGQKTLTKTICTETSTYGLYFVHNTSLCVINVIFPNIELCVIVWVHRLCTLQAGMKTNRFNSGITNTPRI